MYIPSHRRVEGNEQADALAKLGATLPATCATARVTRAWLAAQVKDKFLASWQYAVGAANASLSSPTTYTALSWSDTRAVLRIFTNRTLSDPPKTAPPPICSCGIETVSAHHLLMTCPNLSEARSALAARLPPNIPLDADLAVRSPLTARELAVFARQTGLGLRRRLNCNTTPPPDEPSLSNSDISRSPTPQFEAFE